MKSIDTAPQPAATGLAVPLVKAFTIIAVVILVYWSTFLRIVDMWSLWDYQYGWLVYPLCLYLLATVRVDLAGTPGRASRLGSIAVMVTVFGWLVAGAAGIQVAEFIFATLLISATYWAVMGNAAMRIAAFPLLFFLAAVPMGGFLVEPLMQFTADLAGALLTLSGIAVLRDGQFFELPGGSFEVADVCSGFRYLLSGTILSLAYVYTAYSRIHKQLLFVAAAAAVLVVTNGVRAYIVMAVASATEMRVLGGADHVYFGTALFVIVFIALIWLGERFADPLQEPSSATNGIARSRSDWSSRGLLGVALLVLLSGPMLARTMIAWPPAEIAEAALPGLSGCVRESHVLPADDMPTFRNADQEWSALHRCDGHNFNIYVASYGSQKQGKELIAWGNRIWPNDWRRYVDESTIRVHSGDIEPTVKQVLVRHPQGWRLTRYWYQVGNRTTASPIVVKMLKAFNVLTFQPVEASVVAVTVTTTESENLDDLQQALNSKTADLIRWNIERVSGGGNR